MAIFTYTSASNHTTVVGTEFKPCCGQPPLKHTWPHKRSWRDMVALSCQNPACDNRSVLACDVDIEKKWEKFRKQ